MYSKIILTLFGLILLIACQSNSSSNNTITPEKPSGKKVFRSNCISCHGAKGNLGLNGAKDLRKSELTEAEMIEVVTFGRNTMLAHEKLLTKEEIKLVVEYVRTLK